MKQVTIGVVCNFYREPHTLPSFIEVAQKVFDEVVFVHAPPPGAAPDESIDIVQASGHRLVHSNIEQGFGRLRTFCISQTKCDWTVILDADERIWPEVPVLHCEGTESFPGTKEPNLSTHWNGSTVNQAALLRDLCSRADASNQFAVRLSRRHWFNKPGEFTKPCQNWQLIADWQLRVVKNSPLICYRPERKMHEQLVSVKTWGEPEYLSVPDGQPAPFFDHYHCYFKPMEPDNNAEDMRTYQALDKGLTTGMWLEEAKGVKE